MRAGLADRANRVALLEEKDGRIAGHRLDQHSLGHPALEQHLCELFRHGLQGVRIYPGPDRNDDIPTKVCSANTKRITDKCRDNGKTGNAADTLDETRDK